MSCGRLYIKEGSPHAPTAIRAIVSYPPTVHRQKLEHTSNSPIPSLNGHCSYSSPSPTHTTHLHVIVDDSILVCCIHLRGLFSTDLKPRRIFLPEIHLWNSKNKHNCSTQHAMVGGRLSSLAEVRKNILHIPLHRPPGCKSDSIDPCRYFCTACRYFWGKSNKRQVGPGREKEIATHARSYHPLPSLNCPWYSPDPPPNSPQPAPAYHHLTRSRAACVECWQTCRASGRLQ